MTLIGNNMQQAADLLSKGMLVAVPTETVYGLAANALDAPAVLQIFEVKQRPAFDPLIVHIKSINELNLYAAEVSPWITDLAEAFWPGPLTLVLPKKALIPDIVTSGLSTVGLRMPSHPLTLELLHNLPFPLAAPSANPFGYISPTTAQHVFDQLNGKIPYILDGGPCQVGVESTIVGMEGDELLVYRLGGLSLEDLAKVAPRVRLALSASSNPAAPGMLHSHYAPRKPLFVGNIIDLMRHHLGKRIAVISFQEDFSGEKGVVASEILSRQGDIREAASVLFAAMRRLDAGDADVILAAQFPESGLGRAINDRLCRASYV